MTTKALYASINDVSKQFSLSRATLYRKLASGKIKAVKVGRLTRISLASVEQYFASLPAVGGVTEAV
ncbi:helix-turn-helix domain-containing protein [Kozakia baliensis]|uniref:helix-turn-helix domain-containing protein n=1 Tax=Kozakia baliensis TaxID=153496 RepID=UPI000495AA9C|nr:helix-turn-helix domain-containing protein [Kozakia baliensis]